jgi:hypothetical protein
VWRSSGTAHLLRHTTEETIIIIIIIIIIIKYINTLAVPIFILKPNLGPLEKNLKKIDINLDEMFQKKSRVRPFFDHKRNDGNFWKSWK